MVLIQENHRKPPETMELEEANRLRREGEGEVIFSVEVPLLSLVQLELHTFTLQIL